MILLLRFIYLSFFIFRIIFRPLGDWWKTMVVRCFCLNTLLSVTCFDQADAQCFLGYKMLIIHHDDCVPKRLLTRICTGSCTELNADRKFSEVSSTDRNYFSCNIAETVVRHVPLRCPDRAQRGQFIPRILNVTLPIACMCSSSNMQ